MTTRSIRLRTMALTAAAITAGAFATPSAIAQPRNCADTLAAMPEFMRFTRAIVYSHRVGDIGNANGITVLAPTNDALSRMSPNLLDRIFPVDDSGRRADPTQAPAAVGAHALSGRHDVAALVQGGQFTSMAGTPLSFTASGGVVTVRGADNVQAHITRADIACSNGVIHAIDAVLVR